MPMGIYERTESYRKYMKDVVGPKTKARHAKLRQEKILHISNSGLLRCNKCKEEKPLEQFTKDKKRWCGRRAQCKECCSAYYAKKSREFYHANKDKIIPKRFWYYKKYIHGVTKEQYMDVLIRQGNQCAICKETPQEEHLVIDHNHETKMFRGLLCRKCNAALGMLKDSIAIVKNAADYLEKRGSYGKA